MHLKRVEGFTLIELMVVVMIIALLAILGIPNFIEWIQNSKTRSVAESIQNGLRFAQEEAIRTSRQTTFTATSNSWTVDFIANSLATSEDTSVLTHPLQTSPAGGFENTSIAVITGTPAVLGFNSLGRTLGGASSTALSPITGTSDVGFNITNSKGTRKLRVLLSPSGKVRMCDPDQPTYNVATSPSGCPA